jgi:hypothetical protein
MVINDRVYGKVNVTLDCAIELIKSKSLQRLKGISQHGVPDDYYHIHYYTRYEHSVGVMILLKLLGASEEEQIAGLLHDVSHTAFSHVIDWVFSDGKTENYQDEHHENFIYKSEIPGILSRYGYKTDRIVNYHNFGLLEREIPDICADRVDYALREFPSSTIKVCAPALTTANNKIVFKNKATARIFAIHFLEQQMVSWGGVEAIVRYGIFSNLLKLAIEKKIIIDSDFWQDDKFVVDKLINSNNKIINATLLILKKKPLKYPAKGTETVHKKFRYVDPLFLSGKKLIRLSRADKKFVLKLAGDKKINQQGFIVPKFNLSN